jgi:long-chain alkane monooxygenase
MFLNLFTQCSPSPQLAGLWRHDADRTATGYCSLEYWMDLARQLEAACFDAVFFADTHGIFDVYQGSWAPAVQAGMQAPSIDPVLVIPAMAAMTRQLGFAVTYSTTYHAPYQCARLFSSLDHLTSGRVAWNVVTSFSASASLNGLGDFLSHDERYERADEYVTVVRRLWEESWQDRAVRRDVAASVFTDSTLVRELGHEGKYFNVRGPHQCEPSPQRTPVLYQAGASGRGLAFAARHAEVIFVSLADPRDGAAKISALREAAQRHGRAPDSIKVLQGGIVLVGRDHDEVRAKAKVVAELMSPDGDFAKWSAWTGFDVGGYPPDALVRDIRAEGSQSVLRMLLAIDPKRDWTISDLRSYIALGRRPRRRNGFVGTPAEIADDMEQWLAVGVDGFNLIPTPPTLGIDDVCTLLVPELQRRGLFRRVYAPEERTLRERYFGAGRRYYAS